LPKNKIFIFLLDSNFKSYPAVKIGRLAVSTEYANLKQQAGCRFITVDAYQMSKSKQELCIWI